MLSATIERITHRSSTHVAILGNSSLTSVPHWPYFLNCHGERKTFTVFVRTNLGCSNGSGLPLYSSSFGLGSNISTCEGPPDMKRKMIRLQRGAKCGVFNASGLAEEVGLANNSLDSRGANPSIPNPFANRCSILRRLSGTGHL